MRRILRHRPSPAMIVALVALVMAMGGSALATSAGTAKKHKSSKNSDTKSDTELVKKLAPKLSVKHAATAGSAKTAANAAHANTADNATHANAADNATGLSGLIRWRATVATAGADSAHPNTVTLATVGPFTITGHCYVSGVDTDAATYISTSQDGAAAQGYDDEGTTPLNVSDGDVQISEDTASGATTSHTEDFKSTDDGSWAAETPDGSLALNGFGNQGVWMQGAGGPACSFSGYLLTE